MATNLIVFYGMKLRGRVIAYRRVNLGVGAIAGFFGFEAEMPEAN